MDTMTRLHRKVRSVLAVAALVGFAAACAPDPNAATADTLDLGVLGRWSEPAADVSAGVSIDYCGHTGAAAHVRLSVRAMTGDTTLGEFAMVDDVATAPDSHTPPLAAGTFTWDPSVPNGLGFGSGTAGRPLQYTSDFGSLTITEISYGAGGSGVCGVGWTVTHLRATGYVFTSQGTATVSIRIG